MTNHTKQHPLRRLLQYARDYRPTVALATLFSILNKVFDLAPPALIGAAVDITVQREDSFIAGLGVSDVKDQLLVLAGITLVVWIGESVFQYIYQIYWRNLAQTLEHALRIDTYAHVQDLELAYFEDQSTGGLMSILNDDINQLERFLDIGANNMIQVATTVIVIGGMFFAIAPSVAWLAVLPMPFIIWGSIRFQKRLAPRYAAVREQVGILNGQLANNLSGIATIKSFTAEAHEVERVRAASDVYREHNRRAIRLSSAFVPLIRMVIVLGFLAIMVFGGHMALDGTLNVGVYSVMIFMTQRLLWPLTSLGETLDLYQRAMASTARILDLLDIQSTINDGGTAQPVESVRGDVAFDNVHFNYSNGQHVVLAEFGHGEFLALQPEASERLLVSFYDSGTADDSLYTYHPVDFYVRLGYPAMAKLGLAAVILVIVIGVATIWFVARRVRQRKANPVSRS